MSKVTIEADRVKIEITAEVGPTDLLTAIQGIVAATQRAPMLALPAPATPAVPQEGAPTERQAKILNVLREHPGLNTAQILDRMEVDPKSGKRQYLVQVVSQMHKTGKVAPIPGDEDRKRPRWIIADKSAPTKRAPATRERAPKGALAEKTDDIIEFCSEPRRQGQIREQFNIKSGSGIFKLIGRLVDEGRLVKTAVGYVKAKGPIPALPPDRPPPRKKIASPEAGQWRDKYLAYLATQKDPVPLRMARGGVHDTRTHNHSAYVMSSLEKLGLVRISKINGRLHYQLTKPTKAKAA